MNPSVYLFYFCRLVPAFCLSLTLIATAAAETCLECHAAICQDFSGTSHHVQGVAVSGGHCYACHWEAAADGTVNERYHRQSPAVDLVVWIDGKRPTDHVSGRSAVTFTPAAMGTDRERGEVATITVHCLSCHNEESVQTAPFSGDANSPARYAWDKASIAARYAARETTRWGKYSTATSNRKMQVTKALSAHGNAAANEGGWQELLGYDGEMPLTRGGKNARNVECFDCHNAHGSTITGVTSSYPALNSSHNGGILKQTSAGQSGYKIAYQPSLNSYKNSPNPFNAGAGLCFDCHETAAAGVTPWGYRSTFGAARPIMGYKDSAGFAAGRKGSSGKRGGSQEMGTIASSHLKAGAALAQPPAQQINGLCTACHDPHGVSRTLGSNMAYAVPLLKGSWLTSPYREDGPPDKTPGRRRSGIEGDTYNTVNREAASNLAGNTNYNRINRDTAANFTTDADYNRVNRDAGSNLATPPADYNKVNRDAGANLVGHGTNYNRVNRDAAANFAAEADYNRVNRKAGSNLASPPADYNRVNRDAGANFAAAPAGTLPDSNRTNQEAGSNFGKNSSLPREPLRGMKYHLDRETFGEGRSINENEATFAGLCLGCHQKEHLTGTAATAAVHRTVKGWGNNKEHSFPCAKCHQAHNSGLPRLMQTNCFDQGPAGLRDTSSLSRPPFDNDPATAAARTVGCHVKQSGRGGSSPQSSNWKEVSPW